MQPSSASTGGHGAAEPRHWIIEEEQEGEEEEEEEEEPSLVPLGLTQPGPTELHPFTLSASSSSSSSSLPPFPHSPSSSLPPPFSSPSPSIHLFEQCRSMIYLRGYHLARQLRLVTAFERTTLYGALSNPLFHFCLSPAVQQAAEMHRQLVSWVIARYLPLPEPPAFPPPPAFFPLSSSASSPPARKASPVLEEIAPMPPTTTTDLMHVSDTTAVGEGAERAANQLDSSKRGGETNSPPPLNTTAAVAVGSSDDTIATRSHTSTETTSTSASAFTTTTTNNNNNNNNDNANEASHALDNSGSTTTSTPTSSHPPTNEQGKGKEKEEEEELCREYEKHISIWKEAQQRYLTRSEDVFHDRRLLVHRIIAFLCYPSLQMPTPSSSPSPPPPPKMEEKKEDNPNNSTLFTKGKDSPSSKEGTSEDASSVEIFRSPPEERGSGAIPQQELRPTNTAARAPLGTPSSSSLAPPHPPPPVAAAPTPTGSSPEFLFYVTPPPISTLFPQLPAFPTEEALSSASGGMYTTGGFGAGPHKTKQLFIRIAKDMLMNEESLNPYFGRYGQVSCVRGRVVSLVDSGYAPVVVHLLANAFGCHPSQLLLQDFIVRVDSVSNALTAVHRAYFKELLFIALCDPDYNCYHTGDVDALLQEVLPYRWPTSPLPLLQSVEQEEDGVEEREEREEKDHEDGEGSDAEEEDEERSRIAKGKEGKKGKGRREKRSKGTTGSPHSSGIKTTEEEGGEAETTTTRKMKKGKAKAKREQHDIIEGQKQSSTSKKEKRITKLGGTKRKRHHHRRLPPPRRSLPVFPEAPGGLGVDAIGGKWGVASATIGQKSTDSDTDSNTSSSSGSSLFSSSSSSSFSSSSSSQGSSHTTSTSSSLDTQDEHERRASVCEPGRGFVPDIIVHGFPYWFTYEEIKDFFLQRGFNVPSFRLSMDDRNGTFTGAVLIRMPSAMEALRLSENVHGAKLWSASHSSTDNTNNTNGGETRPTAMSNHNLLPITTISTTEEEGGGEGESGADGRVGAAECSTLISGVLTPSFEIVSLWSGEIRMGVVTEKGEEEGGLRGSLFKKSTSTAIRGATVNERLWL